MPALPDKTRFSPTLLSAKVANVHRTVGEKILEKLPAFLFLLADDYTIQYANGYFNRQFGKTDQSTHCYKVMRRRNSPCERCPAQKVFHDQTEQVWMWEDTLRGNLYEVHNYPYSNGKGDNMVIELGVSINERRKPGTPAKNKRLDDYLRICCHCKNVNDDKGNWQQIEAYLSKKNAIQFSHGICPECLIRYYPEAADFLIK